MSAKRENCHVLKQHHKWGPRFQKGIYRYKACEKCGVDQPLDTSRADRLSAVIGGLNGVVETIRDTYTAWEDEEDEKCKHQIIKELPDKVEGNYKECKDELESLYDEVTEWHDKLQDNEGLANTNTAQMLEEAQSNLESKDNLPELELENPEEWENLADEIESPIGDFEGVEFPGMFGG
jgi:hypothetical protein